MLGHQLHSREVVDVEVVADGCAAAAYAAGGVPVGCCVCVGGGGVVLEERTICTPTLEDFCVSSVF